MEKIPTWTCVVALALFDGRGRWLMQRRPDDKHHGGLWEFPGGKVETGEKPRDALVREIDEELGIAIRQGDLTPVTFAEETAVQGRLPIVIVLYRSLYNGSPLCAREGGELGWFDPEGVARLDKPPLDIALAAHLFEKL